MDYRRASNRDSYLFSHAELVIQKTSLIAEEKTVIFATMQYKILNFTDAKVIDFKLKKDLGEMKIFDGFIDEIMYWHPYIKRIDVSSIKLDAILNTKSYSGYSLDKNYIMTGSKTDVIKVALIDIIPGQLTVDENKVIDVRKWLTKPEEIVVSCVEIEDDYVCIDGHSRLVEAYLRGYDYVYMYLDSLDDIDLYEACLKWCREEGVLTTKNLSKRIVSKEIHKKIWIDRCQTYLGN